MLRFHQILIIAISSALFLSSCSLFQNNKEQNREAVCKELNHRIIFNAATTNTTVATQQRAEMETLNKDYREEGCS